MSFHLFSSVCNSINQFLIMNSGRCENIQTVYNVPMDYQCIKTHLKLHFCSIPVKTVSYSPLQKIYLKPMHLEI